jgi:hypothetical protein
MDDEGNSKDDVKVPEGKLGQEISDLFEAVRSCFFLDLSIQQDLSRQLLIRAPSYSHFLGQGARHHRCRCSR